MTTKDLAKEISDDPKQVEQRHKEWQRTILAETEKLSKTIYSHLNRWYGSKVTPAVIRRMSWTYAKYFFEKPDKQLIGLPQQLPLSKVTQDCYYYTHLAYAVLLSLRIRNVTLLNECPGPFSPLCTLSQDEDERIESRLILYQYLASLLPPPGEIIAPREESKPKPKIPTDIEKRLKALEEDVEWLKQNIPTKKQKG